MEKDVVKETIDSWGIGAIALRRITSRIPVGSRQTFKDQTLLAFQGGLRNQAAKSEEEAGYIAKAQSIADEAFSRLLPMVKAGVSEAELALELEFTMRKLGSDGIAFPFIVVSGARSSLPHGVPTSKRLEPGDFVTFDFGAR